MFARTLRALALAAAGCFSTVALASASDTAAVLYRLNSASNFEQGCFPPCLCPVQLQLDLRGTFELKPVILTGTFDQYAVDEVNFVAGDSDPPLQITGAGKYTIFAEFAVLQRLELDLSVGGQPPQHFDSGWVSGGNGFPDISIVISINGMFCHDTVLGINASPVPAAQIIPYLLTMRSTFQEGCFPPCDCPLQQETQLLGTFALVPLQTVGIPSEFAVVHVNWNSPSPTSAGNHISGSGIYRRTPSIAGAAPLQRMSLNLSVGNNSPAHFDSGLVPLQSPPGVIDVVVSMNDMVCYDIVMSLQAKSPASPSASRLSNSP